MLTFRCARMAVTPGSARRVAASAALAMVIFVSAWSGARAGGMAVGGCVGSDGGRSCVVRWGEAEDPYVRTVPQPVSDEERTRSAEREKKWEQRCQPVVAQDRYGVARYQYAAAGCDLGEIE